MISRETIEKAYIPSDRQLTLNFERQTARVIVKVSGFGDEFKDLNPTLSAVEVYSKLKVPAGESDSYAAIKTYKKKKVATMCSMLWYLLEMPILQRNSSNSL